MYRCELCGTQVGPGIVCQRVVLEQRPVVYPGRSRANLCFDRHGRTSHPAHYHGDPGGAGFEIAREARACPECAAARVRPVVTSRAVVIPREPEGAREGSQRLAQAG